MLRSPVDELGKAAVNGERGDALAGCEARDARPDCVDNTGQSGLSACIGALRPGGTLVAYGFMTTRGQLETVAMFARIFVGARLRGRRGAFYGITML